ncbi:MAG TPA: hypothetical protein V6C99_02655 [Oculatellaceae cyanobacterium]|jgi:hypothetical protein
MWMPIQPDLLKSVRRWIALAGLVICLVMRLINFSGVVLCLEPDGHISLETTINGACRDSQLIPAAEETTHIQAVETLKNKQCVDIPVSLADVKPPESTIFLPTVLADALPGHITPRLPLVKSPWVVHLSNPPPLKPPIHQILDGIILLL